MKNFGSIILISLLLLLSNNIQAQKQKITRDSIACNVMRSGVDVDQICKQLARPKMRFFTDEDVSKKDKEAISIIDNILEKISLKRNFKVKKCNNVDNCVATLDRETKMPYIVYDPLFLKKIKKQAKSFGFTHGQLTNEIDGTGKKRGQNWEATCILAHEIGHHLNMHLVNPEIDSKTPVALELEADEFAGSVLRKLGSTLEQAQKVMYRDDVSEEGSYSHPSRKARLEAIAKGWNSADKNSTTKTIDKVEVIWNKLNNIKLKCIDFTFDARIEGIDEFYRHKDLFSFHIVPSQDAYVQVFVLSDDQNELLIPNEYEKMTMVKAQQGRTFPSPEITDGFEMTVEKGKSEKDLLVVLLTKQPIPPYQGSMSDREILEWLNKLPSNEKCIKTYRIKTLK